MSWLKTKLKEFKDVEMNGPFIALLQKVYL